MLIKKWKLLFLYFFILGNLKGCKAVQYVTTRKWRCRFPFRGITFYCIMPWSASRSAQLKLNSLSTAIYWSVPIPTTLYCHLMYLCINEYISVWTLIQRLSQTSLSSWGDISETWHHSIVNNLEMEYKVWTGLIKWFILLFQFLFVLSAKSIVGEDACKSLGWGFYFMARG